MIHIYDWLELPSKTEEESKVREFLDYKTRTAIFQYKNQSPNFDVFCIYNNKKYKINGASRLGDIWLISDFSKEYGYDLRVAIDECVSFSYTYKKDK